MSLQDKLPLLPWIAAAVGIVLFTPLGKSIQNEFTAPELTHATNEEAMDACLKYATQRVKAELELPAPETTAEISARFQAKTYEYVPTSRYKNSDGDHKILDVYCQSQERSRLFGLIKWYGVLPRINWIEMPDKECLEGEYAEHRCFHKSHMDELIPLYAAEGAKDGYGYYSYPYKN